MNLFVHLGRTAFFSEKEHNFGIFSQNLQAEACQLKAKMGEIQKDIFQVHKETSACMANLEQLDSMKTKLQVGIILNQFYFQRNSNL